MRQYWINFKGKQEGPMSIEKMAQMGVDETAYVWHSGLPDWVSITRVPELADMIEMAKNAESLAQQQQQETPASMPEHVAQQEAAMAGEPELVVGDDPVPVPEIENQPTSSQLQATPPALQHAMEHEQEEIPQCPPSNMAWAIITTLFCCTPAGIVGIVFAFLTKKYYRNGEYERAQKMSDRGAWAIIIPIILGLVFTPLTCASHLSQM